MPQANTYETMLAIHTQLCRDTLPEEDQTDTARAGFLFSRRPHTDQVIELHINTLDNPPAPHTHTLSFLYHSNICSHFSHPAVLSINVKTDYRLEHLASLSIALSLILHLSQRSQRVNKWRDAQGPLCFSHRKSCYTFSLGKTDTHTDLLIRKHC